MKLENNNDGVSQNMSDHTHMSLVQKMKQESNSNPGMTEYVKAATDKRISIVRLESATS